jgi:hypothetical protein
MGKNNNNNNNNNNENSQFKEIFAKYFKIFLTLDILSYRLITVISITITTG